MACRGFWLEKPHPFDAGFGTDRNRADFKRLLHQGFSAVPCLANFFSDGIIPTLKLVKYKCVQPGRVNVPCFVQNRSISNNIDDLAQNAEPALVMLQFSGFAFQRKREFLYNGGIYPGARHGVKSASLKFILHFVPGSDTEKLGLHNMGSVCHADGKSAFCLNIFCRFVGFGNIQGDHIVPANAAPSHIHNINTVIPAKGGDH